MKYRLMTTSEKGLSLIKKHEGLKLKSYVCPAGVWTIGYGHTRGVKSGMVINEAIADELLKEDVVKVERLLNNMKINFRQHQFDALVSFIFNVGEGAFNTSTLRSRIVNGGSDDEIVVQFKRWNKATVNGKKVVLDGLTKRRNEEAALWKGVGHDSE